MRMDHPFGAFGSWDRNAITTLGAWRSKNQSKNIVPSRNDPHLSIFLVKNPHSSKVTGKMPFANKVRKNFLGGPDGDLPRE